MSITLVVTNEVPGDRLEVPEIPVYLGDSVSLPGAKGNQTRLIEWTFKNSSGYSEDVLTLYSASPESPDIFAKYKKRISVLPNGSFTLNHVEWQDGGHYERRINQKERQQYWLRVLDWQKAIVIIEICAFVMNLLSVPSITMLFWKWEERGFGLMHWWLDIGDLVSPILNIAGLGLWIHEGVAAGNMKFTRTAENEEKNETLHREEGQVCPVSS
ncbi:hypothetical protein EOD39_6243 [Acipenser ruthenus]|uniref:Uncharacterized protein n=1 Tax=Acipenser ruthenus TaxID=7906 RepID=A0A444UAT7_ACIRT|nr:hypothetical protein EOD39_6243 [Acipenser ruthenus]